MDYVTAFITGGIICVIGQIILDRTNMTAARILVLFVVLGAVLGGLGVYDQLVRFSGAGATVPLPGFGYLLAKGVKQDVAANGLLGAFSGGLKAASAGVCATVFFSLIGAMLFRSKGK